VFRLVQAIVSISIFEKAYFTLLAGKFMVELSPCVLLVLLFLLFVTPFAGFLSPPLPLVHASFKSLPHDFIPRRGSSGALQPIPLAAPTGLASYGSKGNLTTDAVKGSLTFDSLNLVWMLFLRRTLLTTPL